MDSKYDYMKRNPLVDAKRFITLYHLSEGEVLDINKQNPDLQIPLDPEKRLQYYHSFLLKEFKKLPEVEFERQQKADQIANARILPKTVTKKRIEKYIESVIKNKRFFFDLIEKIKTKDVNKVARFLCAEKTFEMLAEGFLENED